MADDEWVDLSQVPDVADERWLHAVNGSAPSDDSWLPRNLVDLDDVPPVQPSLGGLGFVYPGRRHVFSGPQESAKTLAAYVVGLAVVRSGGLVLLIDFEMGMWDCKMRLRELGATDEDLTAMPYISPETPATPVAVDRLVKRSLSLVIIDAGAGAFQLEGLDDNKRQDVERFTALYIRPFWKAEIATIVLDHVTKNVESRGNYAIGSERKVGGADVHLGFSVVKPISRGKKGTYKITTHKDRGGHLKRGLLYEFELDSHPDTHAMTWQFKPPADGETGEWRPTHLMEKVSMYLEKQVEPVPKNTILAADLGKDEYVRKALEILQREEFVEETKGPNRSLLQTSIVAYREHLDELVDNSDSGTSQVRPGTSRETEESGASVRPTPYRGDVRDGLTDEDVPSTSRAVSDDDDGIPF